MQVAKLSTGQVVELLAYKRPVQFDSSRQDWCLVNANIGCRMRRRDIQWIEGTYIVWVLTFKERA